MTDELDLPVPITLTLRQAGQMAERLGPAGARYLVDAYYMLQDHRMRTANQLRAATEAGEPSAAHGWLEGVFGTAEESIRKVMGAYAQRFRAGRWALAQVGIGPVLAAGCLATFDPSRPTVGHWWRFAGLDPTLTWGRGEKRPYSARAKVLAWKIGDSFVKVSGRDDAFYGRVYRERKAYELDRDTAGGHAEVAAATLAARKIADRETRKVYEAGRLPAGRLDLRARRYAAKMFLAHLHWVWWEDLHGEPPPKPYAISILGHANLIAPPGWPCD